MTVRDSAGTRIVENAAPAWAEGEAWTVSAEPVQTFGNREGEPPLENIQQVFLLPDGGILLSDYGASMVRRFGPDGTFSYGFGGPGDGPSEFGRLSYLIPYRGDSILVSDNERIRATVFDLEGNLGREFSFNPDPYVIYSPATYAEGGDPIWIRQTTVFPGAEPPSTGWSEIKIIRTNPLGISPDTILSLRNQYEVWEGNRRTRLGFPAFGIPFFGTRGIAWVQSDTPELRHYDHAGTLLALHRWNPDRIAVDGTLVDEMVQEALDRAKADGTQLTRAEATLIEARVRDVPYPDFVGVASGLQVDTEGNAWVQSTRNPENFWTVIANDGTWLGSVRMPQNFRLTEIGGDYILGIARDEFDVQTAAVYSLLKPGA